MELPEYDENGPAEMIEEWLDLLEGGVDGVLRPLGNYIKGAGADTIAKSPELRERVISETRLYLISKPSEENRAARMEIYQTIKSLRPGNPNWME